MSTNWRISSINGALLAAYFIPTWTIVAFRIMTSPIHGLYEQPNVSVALFVSDHMHLAASTTVRLAWLLVLGRLTVVAFFSVFLVFTTRASIRKTGGGDEALMMALAIAPWLSGNCARIRLVMPSRNASTKPVTCSRAPGGRGSGAISSPP